MAVAFRANGHAVAANTTTLATTLPAGLASGDFMVMAVALWGTTSAQTCNTPSGWTAVTNSPTPVGGFGPRQVMYLFTRTAGSSESAPTVTTSGNSYYMVDIMAFTGVLTASAVDASASGAWKGAQTDKNYTFPAVTTTVAGDGILLFMDTTGSNQQEGFSTGPAGFGFTGIVATFDSNANSMTAVLGSQAAAGSTGTMACTFTSAAGFDAVGFTLALQAAAGGGAGRTKAPPGAVVSAMVQARNIERKAERQSQTFRKTLDDYLHRKGKP